MYIYELQTETHNVRRKARKGGIGHAVESHYATMAATISEVLMRNIKLFTNEKIQFRRESSM